MIRVTYTKTYEDGTVSQAALNPPSWAAARKLQKFLKAQEEHLDRDRYLFYTVSNFTAEER